MKVEFSFDQLFQVLSNPATATNAFWLIMKLMFLIAFALYIAFAVVVWRQVQLMTNTYQTGAKGPLRILAIVHFSFAVGLFFLALIVL